MGGISNQNVEYKEDEKTQKFEREFNFNQDLKGILQFGLKVLRTWKWIKFKFKEGAYTLFLQN